MRQILICSKQEKPRQALAGEIRVLEIAQEVVETADFDEAVNFIKNEDFSALIMDDPSPEQHHLLTAVKKAVPVFYLVNQPIDVQDLQIFQKPIRLSVFLTALIAAVAQFEQSDEAAVSLGVWKFNFAAKTLVYKETEIRLTEKEAAILNYLHRCDAPVDKETLLREIWGYGEGISTHTLETHIYRLRQKLETTGISFMTGNGEGYRLVCSD